MPGLRLWLLGPSHFELDDQPVDLQRRKVLALLVYLAVTSEAHPRDSLATLLWPELDQSAARTALRRDLSVLSDSIARRFFLQEEATSAKAADSTSNGRTLISSSFRTRAR